MSSYWINKLNIILFFGIFLLASCTQPTPQNFEEYVERPVNEIYNEALVFFEKGQYKKAADGFSEVTQQHPYSIWAKRAHIMGAYVQYLREQYNETILSIESYIRLYPGSDDIEYAYYLRAISYFEQIGDVERDQRISLLALQTLQEVIDRFPDSQYARDATIKIDLTYDQLAGKHMDVGRYYLKNKEYIGAINRFKIVVKDYQTTTHIEEALLRLVEANLALGLNNEAKLVGSVLGHNYPASKWYHDAYAKLHGDIPSYEKASLLPGFDNITKWMGDLIPDKILF